MLLKEALVATNKEDAAKTGENWKALPLHTSFVYF